MPRGEANASKDRCPAGHKLAGDNLRISKCTSGERRVCRACVRAKAAERYADKQARAQRRAARA